MTTPVQLFLQTTKSCTSSTAPNLPLWPCPSLSHLKRTASSLQPLSNPRQNQPPNYYYLPTNPPLASISNSQSHSASVTSRLCTALRPYPTRPGTPLGPSPIPRLHPQPNPLHQSISSAPSLFSLSYTHTQAGQTPYLQLSPLSPSPQRCP